LLKVAKVLFHNRDGKTQKGYGMVVSDKDLAR